MIPVRLYAVFAATPAGGNLAGVVYDDVGLAPEQMQQVARDLGAPTTGFVRTLAPDVFGVRFFSPRTEMAMCGLDTVGVYARLDPTGGGPDLRVRDLCHGVGDAEEAASGTTNGALAALLWRRETLRAAQPGGMVRVRALLGFEMGRPSLITTELETSGGAIAAVRVGGTARCRLLGGYLPASA
jgi:predicted PhzF superfamily epimerase YddE/YHI9